jgi:hypothetical protein
MLFRLAAVHDYLMLTHHCIYIRTKGEHCYFIMLITYYWRFYMKQLLLDVINGLVMAGFVVTTTLWFIVIGG